LKRGCQTPKKGIHQQKTRFHKLKPSWQVGSSLKGRQIEWKPIASRVELVGMNQSFVYHAKNPVCARASNDQRIIRPRILDGRSMVQQQMRLEGLSEEGRQWAKNPELKPKPKPERGMAFAIAHLDELIQKSQKKEQAQRRVGCQRYQLL